MLLVLEDTPIGNLIDQCTNSGMGVFCQIDQLETGYNVNLLVTSGSTVITKFGTIIATPEKAITRVVTELCKILQIDRSTLAASVPGPQVDSLKVSQVTAKPKRSISEITANLEELGKTLKGRREAAFRPKLEDLSRELGLQGTANGLSSAYRKLADSIAAYQKLDDNTEAFRRKLSEAKELLHELGVAILETTNVHKYSVLAQNLRCAPSRL